MSNLISKHTEVSSAPQTKEGKFSPPSDKTRSQPSDKNGARVRGNQHDNDSPLPRQYTSWIDGGAALFNLAHRPTFFKKYLIRILMRDIANHEHTYETIADEFSDILAGEPSDIYEACPVVRPVSKTTGLAYRKMAQHFNKINALSDRKKSVSDRTLVGVESNPGPPKIVAKVKDTNRAVNQVEHELSLLRKQVSKMKVAPRGNKSTEAVNRAAVGYVAALINPEAHRNATVPDAYAQPVFTYQSCTEFILPLQGVLGKTGFDGAGNATIMMNPTMREHVLVSCSQAFRESYTLGVWNRIGNRLVKTDLTDDAGRPKLSYYADSVPSYLPDDAAGTLLFFPSTIGVYDQFFIGTDGQSIADSRIVKHIFPQESPDSGHWGFPVQAGQEVFGTGVFTGTSWDQVAAGDELQLFAYFVVAGSLQSVPTTAYPGTRNTPPTTLPANLNTSGNAVWSANLTAPTGATHLVSFGWLLGGTQEKTMEPIYSHFSLYTSAYPLSIVDMGLPPYTQCTVFGAVPVKQLDDLYADIDSYRLVSGSLWIQNDSDTLSDGGRIVSAMVNSKTFPVRPTASSLQTADGYPCQEFLTTTGLAGSNVLSLYDGQFRHGSYSIWAPSQDSDVRFRRFTEPWNYTQNYIITTISYANALASSGLVQLRVRAIANWECTTLSRDRNLVASVSDPEQLAVSYLMLMSFPCCTENDTHWETIKNFFKDVWKGMKWAHDEIVAPVMNSPIGGMISAAQPELGVAYQVSNTLFGGSAPRGSNSEQSLPSTRAQPARHDRVRSDYDRRAMPASRRGYV